MSLVPGFSLRTVLAKGPLQGGAGFLWIDAGHATKVDGTGAKEAGTAINLMAQDLVKITERGGQFWLGRSEDCHGWYPEKGRQMHRTSIIS